MTRRATLASSRLTLLLGSLACSCALAAPVSGETERSAARQASSPSPLSPPDSAATPPKPLADNAPPIYPSRCLLRREEGVALIRALVSEDGSVASIEIFESSGRPALDAAAAQAVRQWRFEPASRDGRPIALWIEAPVEFKLSAPEPAPVESQRLGSLWRL